MRDLMSKLMTGTMIAGAALLVSACGGGESTNTTTDTNLTEMNSMEPVEGTTNDVTAVDGAMGDSNMAMGSNSSMSDSNMSTEGNMTTNAQ